MPAKSFLEPIEGFDEDTWRRFTWGTQNKGYARHLRKCINCGNKFKKGDRVYRKKTHKSQGKTVGISLYCKECFNSMFFEPRYNPPPIPEWKRKAIERKRGC